MSQQTRNEQPVALTIAGSDSGGGAGIQADLKAFAALDVHGTSAITCTTAQHPEGVRSVHAIPVAHIRDQITQVLDYFDVRAIKTGMLLNREIIEEIAGLLANHRRIPLVVDPVMVATSGAVLLQPEAVEAVQQALFPLADLVTPNLDEVGVLNAAKPGGIDAMIEAARSLARRHQTAFLVKGGHLEGGELVDVLGYPDGTHQSFTASRVVEINTHGSGCTLASAIAAEMAKGNEVASAVALAHQFLQKTFKNPVFIHDTSFLNPFG